MSLRKQRQKSAEANKVEDQVKHLAFNIGGHALQDGMKERGLFETICAHTKSKKSFKAIIIENEKATNVGVAAQDPLFRDVVTYTDRELGEAEVGTQQYLVVGYALRYIDEKITKTKVGQKKQQPVGTKEPSGVFTWDIAEPPVLVVTEITTTQPEGVQLYALLHPRRGLCTPYAIAQDIVFYRHEFRDLTTDKKSRGPAWNSIVAKHSVRPGIDAAPISSKQMKFARAKDSTKLAFSPNISVANEIACLAASYCHTTDMWFLDEIKSVLKTIDQDLNYRPLPENSWLRCFVESEEQLTMEDAGQVVAEFEKKWPGCDDVTPGLVMELKDKLIESGYQLRYEHLRPFIVEGCWRLHQSPQGSNEADSSDFIESLVDNIRRIVGLNKWKPSISVSDRDLLIATIFNKLNEVNEHGLQSKEKFKDVFGDTAFRHSVYDIWEEYANSSDTDTTRVAFMQALKVVVASSYSQEVGLQGMIEDILVPLSKLQLQVVE